MDDFEEIRNDKQFLKNLQEQEKRAIFNQDIIELYEVLDMLLLLSLDDNRLEEVYLNILKIAFDDLKERLELQKSYKLTNFKDALMLRAVYERAIESWSYDDIATAKDLFLMILFLCNDDKLKKPFSIHLIATLKNINIDEFYEKFVNRDDTTNIDEFTNYDYFLMDFRPASDKLFEDGTKDVELAMSNFNPKSYSSIL